MTNGQLTTERPPGEEPEERGPAPITVMLVDDSITFLSIALRYLRDHCDGRLAVVGTAGSGAEAVAWAPRFAPQVFLVDLNMPGMDGFHTIARLREIRPDAAIIALSIMDGDVTKAQVRGAGGDAHVRKADMTTHLLPAILAAIETRGAGN